MKEFGISFAKLTRLSEIHPACPHLEGVYDLAASASVTIIFSRL